MTVNSNYRQYHSNTQDKAIDNGELNTNKTLQFLRKESFNPNRLFDNR